MRVAQPCGLQEHLLGALEKVKKGGGGMKWSVVCGVLSLMSMVAGLVLNVAQGPVAGGFFLVWAVGLAFNCGFYAGVGK